MYIFVCLLIKLPVTTPFFLAGTKIIFFCSDHGHGQLKWVGECSNHVLTIIFFKLSLNAAQRHCNVLKSVLKK